MSDRPAGTLDTEYTPFRKSEEQAQWYFELLFVLLVGGGMYVGGGALGIAFGGILLLLWTRLRVEFVGATSAVLFAGLNSEGSPSAVTVELTTRGLDPGLVAPVLVVSGVGGLLAVELARSWQSIRPALLFTVLFAVSGVSLAVLSSTVRLQWLAMGAVGVLVIVSYGLHLISRFGSGAASSDDNPTVGRNETTNSRGGRSTND